MYTNAILFERRMLRVCEQVLDQFRSYEIERRYSNSGVVITYTTLEIANQTYSALKRNFGENSPLLGYIFPNFVDENHYKQNKESHFERFPSQDYPTPSDYVTRYMLPDATSPTFYVPPPSAEQQLDDAYLETLKDSLQFTSPLSQLSPLPVAQPLGIYSPASRIRQRLSQSPMVPGNQQSRTSNTRRIPSLMDIQLPGFPSNTNNLSFGGLNSSRQNRVLQPQNLESTNRRIHFAPYSFSRPNHPYRSRRNDSGLYSRTPSRTSDVGSPLDELRRLDGYSQSDRHTSRSPHRDRRN